MRPSADEWAEIELGQLGSIVTGRTPPKAEPELFGSDYPFFTPSDMSYGDRSPPTNRFISNDGARRFRRIRLPTGSTCFVCIGATIGKACLTSHPSFTNQQLNSIIPDDKRHDPRFVYYLLVSVADDIKALASGAATPIINKSSFSAFKVKVPSLPTQQRIAAILSAYDDLIETNTRRIAILEEMARRLYEEWFVHFRFPGHDETAFEKRPVSDLAEIVRGRSYKSSELVAEGGRPFVNLKCVNRDGGFRRDGLKRYEGRFKEQQLVSSGDIVMGVTDMTQERRIVARAALVPELGDVDGLISMDLVKIVPKPPTTNVFLYAALRWSDFAENVKNHATGANVLHLHPDRISEYLMPLPPVEYQQRFASVAAPIIEEIELLEQKSANLRAQRELLLPRLVSGEIDVSGAENAMEAAE
ncbi:restriction endonuclease subunit S [uncultured Jannaschia sp.]|uniref:restriction endonuclease subunit S n=1 Tax=uncultured Jannaschia sp. TaxID=293347 RepID=UPI002620E854|nr:restriction endonuclease subunit S [uncultured Jannaschia sp.]